MKDTCCSAEIIAERCQHLRGESFQSAQCQLPTLLKSMQSGADGYCEIMCNFHPQLYAWLKNNYNSKNTELVQSVIGTLGFTETGLPYPLTAKYHMNLFGIKTENPARNRKSEELSEYSKSCIRQIKLLTDAFETQLGIL